MQKVISININTSLIEDNGYNELTFPELDKLLNDGYEIKDRLPLISNSNNLYCVNLTFILEKEEE